MPENEPVPESDPIDEDDIFLESDEEFKKKLAAHAAACVVSQETLQMQFNS